MLPSIRKNKNTSFNIIYVARLHKQKNHQLLFESLKILRKNISLILMYILLEKILIEITF